MSPRPRKASDDQIFAAAYRTMVRRGPTEWTLADIAAEAGLTAGALVQRFGSKHELMVALSAKLAESSPSLFERLRASHRSPLATLRAYADCVAAMGKSPAMLAHHLAYLERDIADPDLQKHLRATAAANRAAIARIIDEASAAGELVGIDDPPALARAIEVTLAGSLLTWGHYQDGSARSWLRHDLAALLARFTPRRRRRR